MTKKLPTKDIANELSASSVFFQPSVPSKPAPRAQKRDDKPTPATQTAETTPPDAPSHQPSNHDTVVSHNRGSTVTSHHDIKQPLKDDQTVIANLGEIRKAVKQLGKEAATYRFRVEEKTAIADIVYTYTRRGVRTSENEITRIAVNWLLLDYRQNGANSLLARLLEELHG